MTTHLGKLSPHRLWEIWKDEYPHHCRTSTVVQPDKVPYDCTPAMSVVLEAGVRTWGFRTSEQLETFKQQYKEHLV